MIVRRAGICSASLALILAVASCDPAPKVPSLPTVKLDAPASSSVQTAQPLPSGADAGATPSAEDKRIAAKKAEARIEKLELTWVGVG